MRSSASSLAAQIAGHLGFRESLRLIGDAIGRPVDDTSVVTRPILAVGPRTLLGGVAPPGSDSRGAAGRDRPDKGTEWLRLTMTASVSLDEAGVVPLDRVQIYGATNLSAVISPGDRRRRRDRRAYRQRAPGDSRGRAGGALGTRSRHHGAASA